MTIPKHHQRVLDQLHAQASVGGHLFTRDIAKALAVSLSYVEAVIHELAKQDVLRVRYEGFWKFITIAETGQVLRQKLRRRMTPAMRNQRNERPIKPEDIAGRIERDQAAIRARQVEHLEAERERYGLPKRARLIQDMVA